MPVTCHAAPEAKVRAAVDLLSDHDSSLARADRGRSRVSELPPSANPARALSVAPSNETHAGADPIYLRPA